jgi:chemotaxis protein histidine kinase CheA
MTFLDRQVSQARRRLTGNVLLHDLSLALLFAAGVWALLIVVVRALGLAVPIGLAGGIAAGAAVVAGVAATVLRRPTVLQAALALDAAAGLKERLSTALLVQREADPFARAAVQDAEKKAASVHVPAHIRYSAPGLWPWSAATVLAALLLGLFMPTLNLLARNKPEEQPTATREQVQAEQQAIKAELEQKLAKVKELAQENPKLQNLANELKPLELPDTEPTTPDDVRRNAVQQIDNVREKLERELEQAEDSGLKQAQRMFQQLNEPGSQKANDKLSQSLASGDFEAAKQALKDMAEDIAEAAQKADDPEAQQKLAEMSQKLEQLAKQISELSDTTRLQKELENKGGLSAEEAKKLLEQMKNMDAKQLEKELQKQLGEKGVPPKQIQELAKKMQQQQQAQKQCQKMSQCMSKAAQAAQQCKGGGANSQQSASQAANALSDAASQLSDMEMTEQMMNELQAQLSEMDKMRQGVCEGQCQGKGDKPGRRDGGNIGTQGPNEGLGYGSRIGKERTAYNKTPEKAKSRYQGGAIIGRMLVEGPQVRGQASAEDLTAAEAEVRDQLDNVEREDVPRQYHKALREYFDRLAGLMKEQAGTPAEEKKAEPAKSAGDE